MTELTHLADLIRINNYVNSRISAIIGRPANTGSIGEFLAAHIFDIALAGTPVTKALDGHFSTGPLAGKSVNIKFYSRFGGLLDMTADVNPANHADYYLVMCGPRPVSALTKGTQTPLVIESVYLFSSDELLQELLGRPTPMRPGIATSIRKHLWLAAMIYPDQVNQALILTEQQRAALALFAPVG